MLSPTTEKRDEPATVASTSLEIKTIMQGMLPAFKDASTGEIHLSLDKEGELSYDHSFDNLPEHWISGRVRSGEAMALIPSVIAGYWRPGYFITVRKNIQIPLDS
jgi:hypothetical protein